MLALLEQTTRLHRSAYENTSVEADFLSSSTKAKAHVTLSIRPIRLIPFGIYSLFHFVSIRNTLLEEIKAQKAEEAKAEEAPKAEEKKEAPKAAEKKEAPKAAEKKEAPKAAEKKEAPKAAEKKEAPKAEEKK